MIEVLDTACGQRFPRDLGSELRTALEALRGLEASQRLGVGYRTNSVAIAAITALQALSGALSDYVDEEPELRPVREYLTDPPGLVAELKGAVSSYLAERTSADLAQLASFSLILFRHYDLDGEVTRSLSDHREQWREALRPVRLDATDLHLAIILPPSATDTVSRLAEQLRCDALLPCIVFMGDKPDFSARGSILTRWSARRLVQPGLTIPEQLSRCYRSVYGLGVPGRGKLLTAAADKLTTEIAGRLDVEIASALVAGGLGGSAGVDAVHTMFQLFGR